MGSTFLPTDGLLHDIAKALGSEPDDPAVVDAFDQLVLRGQLAPWRPGWSELMAGSPVSWSGWLGGAMGLLPTFCPRICGLISEKSIGATGFEPAT